MVLFDFAAEGEGELAVTKGTAVLVLRPPVDGWVLDRVMLTQLCMGHCFIWFDKKNTLFAW